jgi:hypothetical protein
LLATVGAAQAEEIAGAIDANGKPQIESAKYKVSHPGVGRPQGFSSERLRSGGK